MEIRLLGPVEIRDSGQPVELKRSAERLVLAMLAVNLNRRVTVNALVESVWSAGPPVNAESTIGSYVRSVRRALVAAGAAMDCLPSRRPAAYELDVAPELVDYHRFRSLVAAADRGRSAGGPGVAGAYREALSLRSGRPLGGLDSPWADQHRFFMDQEYLDAAAALTETQLEQGDVQDAVGTVMRLSVQVVLDDRFIVLGARALAAAGQRSAVSEFARLAAERMWNESETTISSKTRSIVAELMESESPVPTPSPIDGRATEPVRDRDYGTLIIAHNSDRVFQAAGDMVIYSSDEDAD